jgi:hypothetical protein
MLPLSDALGSVELKKDWRSVVGMVGALTSAKPPDGEPEPSVPSLYLVYINQGG